MRFGARQDGSKSLEALVRPGAMDIKGQQKELFPFDAFSFTKDEKNKVYTVQLKTPWAFNFADPVGDIGGWSIDGGALSVQTDGGDRIIALDAETRRLEVWSSGASPTIAVAIGYLFGIESYTSNDYGIYLKSPNVAIIDGGFEFTNGDYLIQHDAAYLIKDGTGVEYGRFGSVGAGRIGLQIGPVGARTFSADDLGNLTLTGTINATAGTLAALTVNGTLTVSNPGKIVCGTITIDHASITGTNFTLDATRLSASNVIISGAITAGSGAIGGWVLGTSTLTGTSATGYTTVINSSLARFSVMAGTTTKVAMGYLSGLANPAGGTFNSTDYGFWVNPSLTSLAFYGDFNYKNGNFFLQSESALIMKDAVGTEILILGNVGSGKRGLRLYNSAHTQYLDLLVTDSGGLSYFSLTPSGVNGRVYLNGTSLFTTMGGTSLTVEDARASLVTLFPTGGTDAVSMQAYKTAGRCVLSISSQDTSYPTCALTLRSFNGTVWSGLRDIAGTLYIYSDTATTSVEVARFGKTASVITTTGTGKLTVDAAGGTLAGTWDADGFITAYATIGGITLEDSSDRSGLLEINRQGTTGWVGIQCKFSTTGLWSVMGSETQFGLYDDANSEWILLYGENAAVSLYYNGSSKLSTTSTGVSVTGYIDASLGKRGRVFNWYFNPGTGNDLFDALNAQPVFNSLGTTAIISCTGGTVIYGANVYNYFLSAVNTWSGITTQNIATLITAIQKISSTQYRIFGYTNDYAGWQYRPIYIDVVEGDMTALCSSVALCV